MGTAESDPLEGWSEEERGQVVLKLDYDNDQEKKKSLKVAFSKTREMMGMNQKLIIRQNQGHRLKKLPVTIEEVDAPISSKKWLTIRIEAGRNTLKCRVRTDNVYVDAYEVNGRVIYEYRQSEPDHQRLFKNSTILSYGPNYSDLRPSESVDSKEYRKDIYVGFTELKDAVLSLCTMSDWESNVAKAKTDQCVVIMMIAEAIRMNPFFQVLMSGKSVRIGDRNELYYGVWQWGAISRALLEASSRDEDGNWIVNKDRFKLPKKAKKQLGEIVATDFISLVKNKKIKSQ